MSVGTFNRLAASVLAVGAAGTMAGCRSAYGPESYPSSESAVSSVGSRTAGRVVMPTTVEPVQPVQLTPEEAVNEELQTDAMTISGEALLIQERIAWTPSSTLKIHIDPDDGNFGGAQLLGHNTLHRDRSLRFHYSPVPPTATNIEKSQNIQSLVFTLSKNNKVVLKERGGYWNLRTVTTDPQTHERKFHTVIDAAKLKRPMAGTRARKATDLIFGAFNSVGQGKKHGALRPHLHNQRSRPPLHRKHSRQTQSRPRR